MSNAVMAKPGATRCSALLNIFSMSFGVLSGSPLKHGKHAVERYIKWHTAQ